MITLNDVVHWRGEPTAALGQSWIDGVPTRLLMYLGDQEGQLFVRLQTNGVMGNTICLTSFVKGE